MSRIAHFRVDPKLTQVLGENHTSSAGRNGGTYAHKDYHALQLGCTTLDLNNDAPLDLENVHLGRPLNWKPEKAKCEASINGTARLTGRNISINNVTFHTRQQGSAKFESISPGSNHTVKQEGGSVEMPANPRDLLRNELLPPSRRRHKILPL